MKITYSVATRFGGGGIGTTSYQACLGLFKAGLLGRVYSSSKILREIPGDLIKTTGVSFFEGLSLLPSAYQWFLKDVAHDFIVSRDFKEDYFVKGDIFHVWNGHGLFSLRQAKKKRVGVVIERASTHPATYDKIMSEEYRRRGLRFSQMISLNKKRLLAEFAECDLITVPSDFSYRSMIENGVNERKLVKIPFGADTDKFRPVKRLQNGHFNVLFAGQVGLRKGALYLLEAWQKLKLKDAILTVVGQVDQEAENLFKPYRGDSSIRFLGYTDLLPLYQSADVFVFPSLEEGSALVTYEALACGLPLITTLESGSVITDGREGFIVPAGDAEGIAERLRFLYEDHSVRQEMSGHARIRAEEFNWSNYGEKLVRFYERVV